MTAHNRSGEHSEETPEDMLPEIDNINIQDGLDPADAVFHQLNQELDEINNCLDALEEKNDELHDELIKLLEESKQIRSELKEGHSTEEAAT